MRIAKQPARWGTPTSATVIDPSARRIATALKAAPGFARLEPASQAVLLRLVNGSNEELSRPARQAIDALLKAPVFQKAHAQAQSQKLDQVLSEQAWLPSVVSAKRGTFAMQRATYSLAGPTPVPAYPFASGTADAQRYVLEVDGHPIQIVAANSTAEGHTQHPVKEIARALAALPAASRAQVREVAVEPAANPEDPIRAKELSDPDFKSYMVAESGKVWVFASVDVARDQEGADGTFVHETGHFLSALAWGEESDLRWNPWKAAMSADRISPSAYAKVSLSEDFCEAFQLYIQVRGTPAEAEVRGLLSGRFALIDRLLQKR